MNKKKDPVLSITTIRYIQNTKKTGQFPAGLPDMAIFVKWHPLKQTKTKNGHHFRRLTFKVIQLCCVAQKDSFTLKVLKLQVVTVKHDSALISNVECATYHIEAEPGLTEIKCNFGTFGLNQSFWAKQQSCITLKVSLRKWCPFFVFLCFSGCHFT